MVLRRGTVRGRQRRHRGRRDERLKSGVTGSLIGAVRTYSREDLDQALAGRYELVLLTREEYRRRFRVDRFRFDAQRALLVFDRVDLRGRRIEFTLLVPY